MNKTFADPCHNCRALPDGESYQECGHGNENKFKYLPIANHKGKYMVEKNTVDKKLSGAGLRGQSAGETAICTV